MSRIIERFKRLDKNKQIIICLVMAMIILGGLTAVMKSSVTNKIAWNYKTGTIDSSVLQKSTLEYDRNIYWTVRGIVDKYTNSYLYDVTKDETSSNTVLYKDYYTALDSEYTKKLSKVNYEKKAKEFFSKLVIQGEFENEYNILPFTIEKINKYGENMYLCTIKVDEQGGVEIVKGRGYIGIKLDQEKNTFSIFYLGGQYE